MKKLFKNLSVVAVVAAFVSVGASFVVTDDMLTNILQGVAILMAILWRVLDHSGSGTPDFLEKRPRAAAVVRLLERAITKLEDLERRRAEEGKDPLTEEELDATDVAVTPPSETPAETPEPEAKP
jgi:hypothetical protein